MRRRLRKKRRVGEFQEIGFNVTYTPRTGLNNSDGDKLLDAFIEHAIEANNLAAGGGGFPTMPMTFFVTSANRRGSATEADQKAVATWLESCTDIASFEVGALRDAWYGHD